LPAGPIKGFASDFVTIPVDRNVRFLSFDPPLQVGFLASG